MIWEKIPNVLKVLIALFILEAIFYFVIRLSLFLYEPLSRYECSLGEGSQIFCGITAGIGTFILMVASFFAKNAGIILFLKKLKTPGIGTISILGIPTTLIVTFFLGISHESTPFEYILLINPLIFWGLYIIFAQMLYRSK